MAEIIGKAGKWAGIAIDYINSRVVDEGGKYEGRIHDYTQGPINKSWRLLILTQRLRRGFPKVSKTEIKPKKADAKNFHFAKRDSLSEAQREDRWRIESGKNAGAVTPSVDDPEVDSIVTKKRKLSRRDNDLSYAASKHNQIIILNTNTSPVTSIILQNRPTTIQVNNMSYWVSVKSMGRNNPFMMYTGGEDSIQLEVSWFVNDPDNRNEVLTKCRLLESWSKADGYSASPPTLKISWGDANIFENDLFILESAPYQLSNFQSYTRSYDTKVEGSEKYTNIGLAPQYATQTLVFKRVTPNNRTHLDIIPREELEKVNGINIE